MTLITFLVKTFLTVSLKSSFLNEYKRGFTSDEKASVNMETVGKIIGTISGLPTATADRGHVNDWKLTERESSNQDEAYFGNFCLG